jgi:hypothetical protein
MPYRHLAPAIPSLFLLSFFAKARPQALQKDPTRSGLRRHSGDLVQAHWQQRPGRSKLRLGFLTCLEVVPPWEACSKTCIGGLIVSLISRRSPWNVCQPYSMCRAMTSLRISERYCNWRRILDIMSSTSARIGKDAGAVMGRKNRGGRPEYRQTNSRMVLLVSSIWVVSVWSVMRHDV